MSRNVRLSRSEIRKRKDDRLKKGLLIPKKKVTQTPPCVIAGVFVFLEDLGLTFDQIAKIASKLEKSVDVYQKNLSQDTISDISFFIFGCLESNASIGLNSVIHSVGVAFVIFVIFMMLYVLFTVVMYHFFVQRSNNYGSDLIPLVVWFFFSLFFLFIFYFIFATLSDVVSNQVAIRRQSVVTCVEEAIVRLEDLYNTDRGALQKAICAY